MSRCSQQNWIQLREKKRTAKELKHREEKIQLKAVWRESQWNSFRHVGNVVSDSQGKHFQDLIKNKTKKKKSRWITCQECRELWVKQYYQTVHSWKENVYSFDCPKSNRLSQLTSDTYPRWGRCNHFILVHWLNHSQGSRRSHIEFCFC